MAGEVTFSAPMLVGLLATELPDGPPTGFRPLAAALAALIGRGDVPDGSRLPTERALASSTGLSRGAVVAAYDLLREDGLVLRRQGSGTWVRAGSAPPTAPSVELAAALRARRLTARVLRDRDPEVLDLGLSALLEPWGLDPAWFQVELDEVVESGRGHGYLPLGVPVLREALASSASTRGVDVGIQGTAVTLGAQHALSLAARSLVHPGDLVVVESPTFPGAIDAFARAGARFVTIGTDSGGARPDELERVLAASGPRAVYLVPTCQNPTGSVMGASRREQIAQLLDRSGAWLIEDETLSATRFEGPPPRPISSLMRSDRFVVVSSLSKQVWGGLAVGWLHGPERLVERLARLRAADDLGGSVHGQLVALRALDGLEDRNRGLRAELARRAELMSDALGELLPSWTVSPPDGGLSLWCGLPAPVADRLAALAPRVGVSVLPGTSATADATGASHVRLCFAGSPDDLLDGVERLSDAWAVVSCAEGGA